MDYSAASQYDNLGDAKYFSDSVLYQAIGNILELAGNSQYKLYCPFCLESFEYKFSLMEHLKHSHNRFMIDKSDNDNIQLEQCPFCYAKFYGRHLTAKHVLSIHANIIPVFYFGASYDKNVVKCLYCPSRFKRKSHTKFACHIAQDHFLDFCDAFREKFLLEKSDDSSLNMSHSVILTDTKNHPKVPFVSVVNIQNVTDFSNSSNVNCYDFTELKEQLENIKPPESSIFYESTNIQKSILKSMSHYDKGDFVKTSNKKSARRILRFDLPDSLSDKENTVFSNNAQSFKAISIDEQKLLCSSPEKSIQLNDATLQDEPQYSSTPNAKDHKVANQGFKMKKLKEVKRKSLYQNKPSGFKSYIQKNSSFFTFQCGKCSLIFDDNMELVNHIKKSHFKFTLNLLQPCYQCGVCSARFFKNSYLKKHSKLHSSQSLKRPLLR